MTSASPLARKLGAFVALSDEDLRTLDGLHGRRRRFVAGIDLVHQGQVCQPGLWPRPSVVPRWWSRDMRSVVPFLTSEVMHTCPPDCLAKPKIIDGS